MSEQPENPSSAQLDEQLLGEQLYGLPTDLQVALMGLVDATVGLDDAEKVTLGYQVRGLVRAVDRPRIKAADGSRIEAHDPLARLLKGVSVLILAADAAAHGQTIRQRLGDRARDPRGRPSGGGEPIGG